ncbi:MAG: L,D-transpeptidase [Calothrix sp. MO_192.B10]|nr:L,D-transpeptidase [Calothrix sp. MO_192.B10]
MVRSEFIARIVMWLCFATAALSLAVHWRLNNSMKADAHSQAPMGNKTQISSSQVTPQQQFFRSQNPQTTGKQNSSQRVETDQPRIIVDLSDRRVYVYRQSTVVASYPIGVGKKGWETPTGSFKVMHMQHNPAWRHPITGQVFPAGANSPLGLRWIGFWTDGHSHIGFHGTPNDEVVGNPVSHGCLRMRNPDVVSLYNQVRLGTQVEVQQ